MLIKEFANWQESTQPGRKHFLVKGQKCSRTFRLIPLPAAI